MTSAAATPRPMSAAEFLAWERTKAGKHEYHRGETFAMAGGSPRHNFLSNAAGAELRAALRGKPCQVLSSGQRISAEEGVRYVYADAVAVCGGFVAEPGTVDVLANPSVIVEILSGSTEAYDRGQKWGAYQRLPSLTDYLLISQTEVRIEHYQRGSPEAWRYRRFEAGESVGLSRGAALAVDAIYEGAFDLPAD